jgi:ribosomal-protein-alanine N-acetyltransferase
MHESDVRAVARIERQSYPQPWPPALFRRLIRGDGSCWVLTRKRAIIGYGVMRIGQGWVHIMNVAVAPRFRGRGLGRALMQHLLAEAHHRRADRAWLEVRPTSAGAVRLYRSLGFRPVGRRRHYYREGRLPLDAIVMTRGFTPGGAWVGNHSAYERR